MKLLATAALTALLGLAGCGETADLKAKLWPSAWQATEISGVPVLPGSTVTLNFDAAGQATGTATCNRYMGPATLDGDKIDFGALAGTRMACVGEGLNEQEAAFMKALSTAERVALAEGGALEIYSTGTPKPTRFTPVNP